MAIKLDFLLMLKKQWKKKPSFRSLKHWFSFLILGSAITVSSYIFYVYYELKEERENSIYINRLSGVTQQLRQTVYNAFSESGQ